MAPRVCLGFFSGKKGLQNAGVDAKIFLARGGLTWDVTEVMLVHQDEAPNIYAHISKARPLESSYPCQVKLPCVFDLRYLRSKVHLPFDRQKLRG